MYIFALLICPIGALGQDLTDCGVNDNPELNGNEAKFLNTYFAGRPDTFDFRYKKLLFVYGSSGTLKGSKSWYFEQIRQKTKDQPGSKPFVISGSGIVVLSESERIASGGYDAIITYYVKQFTNRRKRITVRDSGREIQNGNSPDNIKKQ